VAVVPPLTAADSDFRRHLSRGVEIKAITALPVPAGEQ
jgi:hypothetical protein